MENLKSNLFRDGRDVAELPLECRTGYLGSQHYKRAKIAQLCRQNVECYAAFHSLKICAANLHKRCCAVWRILSRNAQLILEELIVVKLLPPAVVPRKFRRHRGETNIIQTSSAQTTFYLISAESLFTEMLLGLSQ
jgi:hypothetical protein